MDKSNLILNSRASQDVVGEFKDILELQKDTHSLSTLTSRASTKEDVELEEMLREQEMEGGCLHGPLAGHSGFGGTDKWPPLSRILSGAQIRTNQTEQTY